MKNIKNWKLIAALGLLVLIFAAVRIFRSPGLERNLPETLADIDTAAVTELVIVPAKDRATEIHLIRSGKEWSIRSGEKTGRLEQGGAVSAMRALMELRPERFITRKKEKWNEYSVGDSSATQVKVMRGNSVEADIRIGRTGVNQRNASDYSNEPYTYVRVGDESEVYTVNAFLDGQFNRTYTDWLDKSYTRIKSDSVIRVSFRYPGDSSFVLEKKANLWMSGTELADSIKVTTWLRDLGYKNLNTIVETIPADGPAAVITFEGKSGEIAKLEGWPGGGPWLLRSSHQPGTLFSSEGSAVLTEVWKGRRYFLPR